VARVSDVAAIGRFQPSLEEGDIIRVAMLLQEFSVCVVLIELYYRLLVCGHGQNP
jgi:hypothetical protein